MTFLKRAMWAAAAAAVLAGGVSAQTIGGLGGSTGGTGSLGGGTGGGGTGGGLGGLLGGLGGGGTGGGGSGALGGQGSSTNSTGTNSGVTSVTITAPSSYAQAPQGVATSNVIARYYANPFYQGRAGSNTSSALTPAVVNPGGFGTATFGATGGAATTTGGTGGRGGAGGTTGGFGSTTGGVGGGGFGATGGGTNRQGAAGGLGGAGATNQQQAAQVASPGPVSLSYTATIRFATPTVTTEQFTAELRAVIDRTSQIANPAGVQVIVGSDKVVTLRGRVKDDDEARIAEGLLRITPGVRDVRNELTFPKQ